MTSETGLIVLGQGCSLLEACLKADFMCDEHISQQAAGKKVLLRSMRCVVSLLLRSCTEVWILLRSISATWEADITLSWPLSKVARDVQFLLVSLSLYAHIARCRHRNRIGSH